MTKHAQLNAFINTLKFTKAQPEAPKYFMYKDGITVGMQTVDKEIKIVFSDALFCKKISVIFEKMLKGQFKRREKQ